MRTPRPHPPARRPGAGWRHGTSQDYLTDLLTHWRDRYDWRAQEAALNEMPRFRASVNGLGLHFVHARGKGPNPVPLLFNHGWGGSFWEVHKIIGPLTSTLAFRHAASVTGLHLNLALMTPYLGPDSAPLTKAERRYIAEVERWQQTDGAYLAVHNTKPQSLAYGLNDSPAGLAGWLLDKFHAFSDCGGDLSRSFTMDELITNLMIYWTTGTIGSSLRLYAEGVAESVHFGPDDRITPPTALARFPAEIFQPPREWVERLYHLTRFRHAPRRPLRRRRGTGSARRRPPRVLPPVPLVG